MNRPTLRRVLVTSFAVVTVGGIALTVLGTVGLTRLGATQRALADLEREVDGLASLAADLPCPSTRRGLSAAQRELGQGARFLVDDHAFRDRSGRTDVRGRDTLYASRPATLCGIDGTLVVLREPRDIPPLPAAFTPRLLLSSGVALVVASVVGFVLARRVTRPLTELAAVTRSVPAGQARPSEATAGDVAEVADLKAAFASMLDDLQTARQHERTFLMSISHELRTPLTAIRGYGEALADGSAPDPQRAGTVIDAEAQRLERLVRDLLDLARLEAGEFTVEPADVDLRDVASSVVDALAPAAADAEIGLILTDAGPAPATTDPDRVHQIVANLIENAVRVTPAGGAVAVEVADRAITVRDAGPGLQADDLSRVFERFHLWRRYRGEREVGSGLGLAIVGELTGRLDVQVDVASDDGGTTFTLRFP